MSTILAQLLATFRARPIVSVGLALAFLVGVGNYFLWEERGEIARQNDEARRKGDAILNALVARQHVAADLAKLTTALEVIDRSLLVETDMEVNLGYFYRLEKLCGVRVSQLNQLSAAAPAEGEQFKQLPFSLRATGEYGKVMNFLHQLETGPRIITIRSFNFTRGDPKSNLLSIDLTVTVLARK